MKDYMERFEKVGQKVLGKYILILLVLLIVPAVLAAIIALGFNLSGLQAQAIALGVLSAAMALSTVVALLAINRVLAATLVMVVREIAHAAQATEGEEALAPARVRVSGQVREAAALEGPARTVKPGSERAERKPTAATVSAEKKCPYCGRTLPFGDIHTLCPYCGRRLR